MHTVARGTSASLSFLVEENMQAAFGDRLIHPVLSTAWLVHHLEWAARLVIEPAREQHEEDVGVGVDIRHLGAAPLGETVEVRAVARKQRDRLLVCEVSARCRGRDIARGRVFQAVLERGRLRATRAAGSPRLDGEE